EQAQGIDQVNTAVSEMDKVVQQNAANAEESASASEELSSQAQDLNVLVGQLLTLVNGAGDQPILTTARTSEPEHKLKTHVYPIQDKLRRATEPEKMAKLEEVVPLDDMELKESGLL
ncbi:MAG: methyl-accepting chemotaxis protein, partial [Lentisphaerota bacterium]